MTSMRTKLTSRVALAIGATLSLPTLFACLEHPLKEVFVDLDTSKLEKVELAINKDVDILFVIDNSWSMGEEQGNLAANFPKFIEVLEDPKVKANYRIAITTTDNGHKACNSKPGGGGALRLQSCLDREQEFTDPADSISRFNTACKAHCKHSDSDLEITPTTTDQDAKEKKRPWIQNIEGVTNLPANIPAAEAFACYGPQGINGCGYEAQLESMYRALGLSLEKNQPSYDFIRQQAILAIVHVTDEADCSYNHKGSGTSAVFDNDNTKFWANPDVGPTSSICWNAGVHCSGESNGYYENCEVKNFDINRKEVTTDDEEELNAKSVLFPLERYFKFVDAIEEQKKTLNNDQELIVALIGGVGKNGQPEYPTGEGTDHFNQFGIGPGCVGKVDVLEEKDPTDGSTVPEEKGVDSYAVPPVRLAKFVEHYDDDDSAAEAMHSVCDGDYSAALKTIADKIREQIQPACYRGCARNTRPNSPWLVPECVVTEIYRGSQVDIPECKFKEITEGGHKAKVYEWTEDEGYTMPSEKDDACYALRVDAKGSEGDDSTKSKGDDLAQECIDDGFNLQFVVERRQGKPAKPGTVTNANCELSTTRDIDCPGLGF